MRKKIVFLIKTSLEIRSKHTISIIIFAIFLLGSSSIQAATAIQRPIKTTSPTATECKKWGLQPTAITKVTPYLRYRIQQKDSLYKILRSIYLLPKTNINQYIEKIKKINPGITDKNSKLLTPGTWLFLPITTLPKKSAYKIVNGELLLTHSRRKSQSRIDKVLGNPFILIKSTKKVSSKYNRNRINIKALSTSYKGQSNFRNRYIPKNYILTYISPNSLIKQKLSKQGIIPQKTQINTYYYLLFPNTYQIKAKTTQPKKVRRKKRIKTKPKKPLKKRAQLTQKNTSNYQIKLGIRSQLHNLDSNANNLNATLYSHPSTSLIVNGNFKWNKWRIGTHINQERIEFKPPENTNITQSKNTRHTFGIYFAYPLSARLSAIISSGVEEYFLLIRKNDSLKLEKTMLEYTSIRANWIFQQHKKWHISTYGETSLLYPKSTNDFSLDWNASFKIGTECQWIHHRNHKFSLDTNITFSPLSTSISKQDNWTIGIGAGYYWYN